MRIAKPSQALLAGLAAALMLLGCEQPTDAPTAPEARARDARPEASSTSTRYDLSKVPKSFFAPEAMRVPRGFGATSLTATGTVGEEQALHVVNGSFERNGGVGSRVFAGWTVANFPRHNGSWFVQSGFASPLNGFIAFAPPAGAFAAMTDQTGPGARILYQDVRVPRGRSTLSFRVSLFNQTGVFITPNTLAHTDVPNQQFRMDIMTPSAGLRAVQRGLLRRVFRTEPGDPPLSGYRTITTSLDEFAGRTIRLRFAEVDNQGFFQVGIDNVRITTR